VHREDVDVTLVLARVVPRTLVNVVINVRSLICLAVVLRLPNFIFTLSNLL
jgi:hypothetical protein